MLIVGLLCGFNAACPDLNLLGLLFSKKPFKSGLRI